MTQAMSYSRYCPCQLTGELLETGDARRAPLRGLAPKKLNCRPEGRQPCCKFKVFRCRGQIFSGREQPSLRTALACRHPSGRSPPAAPPVLLAIADGIRCAGNRGEAVIIFRPRARSSAVSQNAATGVCAFETESHRQCFRRRDRRKRSKINRPANLLTPGSKTPTLATNEDAPIYVGENAFTHVRTLAGDSTPSVVSPASDTRYRVSNFSGE